MFDHAEVNPVPGSYLVAFYFAPTTGVTAVACPISGDLLPPCKGAPRYRCAPVGSRQARQLLNVRWTEVHDP